MTRGHDGSRVRGGVRRLRMAAVWLMAMSVCQVVFSVASPGPAGADPQMSQGLWICPNVVMLGGEGAPGSDLDVTVRFEVPKNKTFTLGGDMRMAIGTWSVAYDGTVYSSGPAAPLASSEVGEVLPYEGLAGPEAYGLNGTAVGNDRLIVVRVIVRVAPPC